ncbi:MAG TPA: hypothetical protein VFS16_03395 [Acidimicrobiia bacterium]|nr:hypothetical protein [Acidimicrobiia bacterium]
MSGEVGRGRSFRPWPWFGAWVAAGGAAALLIGGAAGARFAACFAAGAAVLGFYLWRVTRGPRRRDVYRADHRPTLVLRVDPPLGLPRWLAPAVSPTPVVSLESDDETWLFGNQRWGLTYAVDAPPGTWTLEIWAMESVRTARLDVTLHMEGRLYVEYRPSWLFFLPGTISWRPAVPDGVAIDGTLQVERVPKRRTSRRR